MQSTARVVLVGVFVGASFAAATAAEAAVSNCLPDGKQASGAI